MLRVVGDVHGLFREYIPLVKNVDYSLQLGDMGFDYSPLIRHLDPTRHRFIGGNHDNYDTLATGLIPHYLGDFGIWEVPDHGSIFFVRGAFSIDRGHRTEGVDWWRAEELEMAQTYKALELYCQIKPSIVATHDCPESVISGNVTLGYTGGRIIPSRTGQLLSRMFEEHQPKLWMFGHHHQNAGFVVSQTQFVCVNELSHIDLTPDCFEG